jgi:hypothetical protein
MGEIDRTLEELQKHMVDYIGAYTWEKICRKWTILAGLRNRLRMKWWFSNQPGRQPPFKRRLALTGMYPVQQLFNADILAHVPPVNAQSLSDQAPIVLLVLACLIQPRIPGDRG